MMGSSTTLEAPSAEAQAEAEAALAAKSLGEMSIGELVEIARAAEADHERAGEAVTELEAREDEGDEEARHALAEFTGEPEGAVSEEEMQQIRDDAALPTAADDDGSDIDLSQGIELQLPGLEGVKLSFSGIGGKKPDESWLRVVGGAFPAPGQQFEKGQDVHVELRLRVTEVAFADTLDSKTAQATTSKRVHKGRVIGAVVIEQAAADKLAELTDAVHGFLDNTVSRSVLAGILGREDEQEQPATAPMV